MRKQIAFYAFVGSLLLCINASAGNSIHAQQAAATRASAPVTLNLAGLKEKVTVRRDERSIPYIEAANEADLYFAQGYVTASDRLWQMDLLRRAMRGELAEILGRDVLAEDKRHRLFGFAQLSEAMLAYASLPVRAALEAYARGVNAYIESLDAKELPPEFQILSYRPRAWKPADSIVIGKLFAESLSTTWQSDLMRATLADLPVEKRRMLLGEMSPLDLLVVGSDSVETKASIHKARMLEPFKPSDSKEILSAIAAITETRKRSLERVGLFMEDGAVSNNWVVSGKHTTSGKPILANDPHLQPSVPSIWYMTHLSIPGMRVAGVTPPGAPGILLGHNEYIAWGATNLGPDVQDLYLEKFDKENPRRYMTPGGWREAEVRREEIKVRKGFTDSSVETEMFDVTVTRHGPIIFEKDGSRYALGWTALDPKAIEFEAFFYVNRARNWNTFRESLSRYAGPTQNFVYADRDGHIGYYGAGRIPIRKRGDGSTPYDGATDDGDWTGYIPFDSLPHVYDPPQGIIVTANQRVAGASYPYFLTHEWASPLRARRIHELLEAKPKLNADDSRVIQSDTFHIGLSTLAREVVKLAGKAPTSSTADEKWGETLRMLGDWDGRLSIESRVAPLIVEMRRSFRRRILERLLGVERAKTFSWGSEENFFYKLITERPQAYLPEGLSDYLTLWRACEKDARESLTKQLGADETKWTWGNYRPTRLRHPLASVPLVGLPFVIAPFPQNGGGNVVNVGPSVSMRLIATPDNWDTSRQGIALGESGNPSSKHFKDQLEDWLSTTLRLFPFTRDSVVKAAQSTLVLMPSK